MASSKASTYFSNATTLTTLLKPGGAPVTYDNAVVNKVPDPGPLQIPQAPPPQLATPNSDSLPPPPPGKLLISPFKNGSIFTIFRRKFATIVGDPGNSSATIPHGGLDLVAADGDPKLYACCTGTVTACCTTYYETKDAKGKVTFKSNALGYYITIQNSTPILGKVYQFMYLHMAGPPKIKGEIVKVGTPVTIGDYIGDYDNTGYSGGAHLHFNVVDFTHKPTSYGTIGPLYNVDPEPIFASQGVFFT